MKDFKYYEGSDITHPTLKQHPSRPRLKSDATPDDYRVFADELEQYESKKARYREAMLEYRRHVKARYDEFLVDLKREMNLPEKAADCIIEFVKENISYNDLEDFHEACHDQLYLFGQINACLD